MHMASAPLHNYHRGRGGWKGREAHQPGHSAASGGIACSRRPPHIALPPPTSQPKLASPSCHSPPPPLFPGL